MRYFLFPIVFLITAISYSQSVFYPEWTNSAGVHITPGSEVLMKDSTLAGFNSGARSIQVLDSLDTGWVRYTVSSNLAATRAFGLASTDPNYSTTSIDYCVRLNGLTAYFQRGVYVVATMSISIGDELEIEKTSSNVYFKLNGVTVVTDSNGGYPDLFVDVAFHTTWGYFDEIQCSFGQTYAPDWVNLSGVNRTQDSLVSTAALGWGNSGASSHNVIKELESGWVEYVIADTSSHLAFGLSYIDESSSYKTIDFGFVVKTGGTLELYQREVLIASGSYLVSDLLRIERIGNEVIYSQNNSVLHTVQTFQKEPLILDVGFYRPGSFISNNDLTLSFDSELHSFVSATSLTDSTLSLAQVRSYGIDQLQRYYWNGFPLQENEWEVYKDGLDSTDQVLLDSLQFLDVWYSEISTRNFGLRGEYQLTTYDSLQGRHLAYFDVGIDADVDTIFGMTFSDQVLTKTAVTSSGPNANFEIRNGILSGSTTGSISIQPLNGQDSKFRIGLKEWGVAPATAGQHIKWGIQVSNGSLSCLNNGSTGPYLGRVFGNEKLTMEVSLDSVFYFKDGELLSSYPISSGAHFQIGCYIEKQNDGLRISSIKLDKPIKPIVKGTVEVDHLRCGDLNSGEVRVNIPVQLSGCLLSFEIYDSEQNLVSTNGTGIFQDLFPGDYVVKIVPPSGCPLSMWSYDVSVGYDITWEELQGDATADYTYDSGLYNSGIAYDNQSYGVSQNFLFHSLDGWVEFQKAESSLPVSILLTSETGQIASRIRCFDGFAFCTYFNETGISGYDIHQGEYSTVRIIRNGNQYSYQIDENLYSFSNSAPLSLAVKGLVPYPASSVIKCATSFPCMTFDDWSRVDRNFRNNPVYCDNGHLKVSYFENYHDDELAFKVFAIPSESNAPILENVDSSGLPLSVIYGLNPLDFDFSGLEPGYYLLQIEDEKNQIFKVKFKR